MGVTIFEEHKELDGTIVRSSVGNVTHQVIGLDAANISTLDLFLKGNPITGKITAAYRINSNTDTPIPFTQELQFNPQSTPPEIFSKFFANEATARAGILAFTANQTTSTPKVAFSRFDAYSNPAKFTWRKTSTLAPTGRSEGPSAVVNGKLYVFGGFTPQTTNFVPSDRTSYEYNPAADIDNNPATEP